MSNEIMLEGWSVTINADPYKAPEQLASRLHGRVFGHPLFVDGSEVTTSDVTGYCEAEDHLVITTRSGSRYVLGDVDPEYEKRYPNARERLWRSLLGLGND